MNFVRKQILNEQKKTYQCFTTLFRERKLSKVSGVSNKLIFFPSKFPRLNTLSENSSTYNSINLVKQNEGKLGTVRGKLEIFLVSRNRVIFPLKGRFRENSINNFRRGLFSLVSKGNFPKGVSSSTSENCESRDRIF